MTGDILVGIYNGSVQFWNDSQIQTANPGLLLPHARILPLARGNKSGSTKVVTTAFSSFSPAWNNSYNIFDKRDKWPRDVIKWFGPDSGERFNFHCISLWAEACRGEEVAGRTFDREVAGSSHDINIIVCRQDRYPDIKLLSIPSKSPV